MRYTCLVLSAANAVCCGVAAYYGVKDVVRHHEIVAILWCIMWLQCRSMERRQ